MASQQSQKDSFLERLRAVLIAADEFPHYPDLDSVYHRAVEFARSTLHLERCAIFIADNGFLQGTYGTDMRGEMSDEHSQRFPINDVWLERIQALQPLGIGWITVDEERYEWDGAQARPQGVGWIALTPIHSSQKLLGMFFNDAAMSGNTVNPDLQELVAVFCSLLGSTIERKRAENALAEERNLLRTLIDSVPDRIYVKDRQARFVVGNAALAQLVGRDTPDQLIGRTDLDLFPLERATRYFEDDETVMRTGEPLINHEELTTQASGKPRWVLTTKIPRRNQQGEIVGLVGIGRDITPLKAAEEALRTANDALELRIQERIAELKQAQESLKQREAFLRQVIDATPNPIFVKDSDGKYVLANQAIAEINGMTVETMIGKSDSDLGTAPEEVERFVRDDREVLTTLQPKYIPEETLNNLATGQSRLLQTIKVPLLSEDGIARHVLGVSLDITERKRAQEALKQQQEYLRRVIDAVPDQIFVKNWDGNYVLVNRALADMYDTTVEALVEGHDRGFENTAEELDHFVRDDREVMTTRKPKVIPEETVTDVPTGRSRTLRTVKVPLLSAEGNAWQVLGVSIDITEQRRAERDLQASEERYRTVTELISNYAFAIRVEPDGTLVDEWITADSFTRCTGYLWEEIGNQSSLYFPEDVEAVQRQFDAVLQGQAVVQDCRIITKSGQLRWLRLRCRPVWDEDEQRVVRYFAAAEDITAQKSAEEVQRESERLRLALDREKELGDLKTQLMVTISHEFRTPLSVAYASAELMENYYERMSSHQREQHLHRIETQVGKLTGMLEEISLIIHARFERLALNLEPVNLKDLCEAVILQLQDFDQAHERIVLKVDEPLPDLLLDVRRVKYVLTNLLSNALKYSDQATNVTLDLFRQNEGVVIRIVDHGIGIPREEQSRIFEPFYRAHNVGAIGGTGLGLSIVKEIVELHKGTISLQSDLNRGTQIEVFLPVDEP